MQVAIDGPAGSGKSTVCKILAKKYGLTYLDTGAMYRAAAWLSGKFTGENLPDLLKETDFVFSENGSRLLLRKDKETWDVSEAIRTPAISGAVSRVAADPQVRAVLTEKQREYAAKGDVIMEGRDITTVVLPNANIKVYLTASAEERAKRRFAEWATKPAAPTYEEVLESIKCRDEIDSSRSCAPLKKADDAAFLDTTGLTLEQVSENIGRMIAAKRGSI